MTRHCTSLPDLCVYVYAWLYYALYMIVLAQRYYQDLCSVCYCNYLVTYSFVGTLVLQLIRALPPSLHELLHEVPILLRVPFFSKCINQYECVM